MLELGGVRDSAEFTRRLTVTAALLVAYRLGTHIPLPGTNLEGLSHLSGAAVERISIFALGVTPLISVLILAELLKVLAPRVRRWEQADPHHHIKLTRIVVGLSLLAAAAQASGIALALENVTGLVDEPGTPFRLTTIATLVGATAIVIWLADQITRHGLGSGMWLLLVTPWLAAVPHRIAVLASWHGPTSHLAVVLLVGCALAALVLASVIGLIRAANGSTLDVAATCLWSLLLAGTAWPWLLLFVELIVGGGSLRAGGALIDPANPILLLVLAGLVVLFVHLYLRSQHIAGAPVNLALPPALFGSALAAIKFVEILLAMQLAWVVPLAAHLILIAVVALSLLQRWWQPPIDVSARDIPRNDATST